MQIIYRILGFIINTVALLLAISLVVNIGAFISSPLTMLSGFITLAVVLYSYNSYKFFRLVVQRGEVVKASLRDLIRVNGIVCRIMGFLIMIEIPFLLKNPQLYKEAIESIGGEVPKQSIVGFFVAMFIYGLILTVHVFMTFSMLKKYKEHFE